MPYHTLSLTFIFNCADTANEEKEDKKSSKKKLTMEKSVKEDNVMRNKGTSFIRIYPFGTLLFIHSKNVNSVVKEPKMFSLNKLVIDKYISK